MTNLVNQYFKVLDDGFIALKGFMGSDEEVEQAARVSYGKGTRQVSDTRDLLRYLYRHYHGTPFEMCEMKIHVRAPIYVVRQWFRHRMQSYNEYSGRYSEMIDSMEKTSPDSWRLQAGDNKQGSGGYIPPKTLEQGEYNGDHISAQEEWLHNIATDVYKQRLKKGIAKEQARKDLPVSNYTEFYAKTDLRNWFGFLTLRCDSHAQLEIRKYANIIAGMTKELFPLSFEAWYDYAFLAKNWTRLDQELMWFLRKYEIYKDSCYSLDDFLNKETTSKILEKEATRIGMSKREIKEFKDKIKIPIPQSFDLNGLEVYDMKGRE